MKVLILAAGTSNRLRPLTTEVPKTLLALNDGMKMIDHILANCYRHDLKEFYFVTGHGHEHVKKHVENFMQKKGDATSEFIYNSEYSTKGNIHSFYLAQKAIHEDYICIHSDVIFHHDILAAVLNHPEKNVMAVDDQKELGLEEMKVVIDKDDKITKIHKSLNPVEAHGEHIGVSKISKNIREKLLSAIEETLAENDQVYYEDSLQKLINQNVPFHFVSTNGRPCMEIDTHEDLAKAKKLIKLCP